ncbi:MAG: TIM barrel protein, partial [Victivallaceae bacterium]|nr:TIM barrel protein [Victivallaceae bacterium]
FSFSEEPESPELFHSQLCGAKKIAEHYCGAIGSIHLPFMPSEKMFVSSPDESLRKKGVEFMGNFIRSCKGIPNRHYTLHSISEPVPDSERGARIAALRRSMEELLPFTMEQGASLNLELLPRSCIGNTAQELLQCVDGLPKAGIGVCIDVNHFMSDAAGVPDAIERLAPWIRTMHLSNYDGVDECHWHCFFGVLDWRAILAQLRKLPQDVLCIFEVTALQPPVWHNRTAPIKLHFDAAEKSVFFLENIDELTERFERLSIA